MVHVSARKNLEGRFQGHVNDPVVLVLLEPIVHLFFVSRAQKNGLFVWQLDMEQKLDS